MKKTPDPIGKIFKDVGTSINMDALSASLDASKFGKFFKGRDIPPTSTHRISAGTLYGRDGKLYDPEEPSSEIDLYQ